MKLKVVLAGKVKDINYINILNEFAKRIKGNVEFEFLELKVAEDSVLKEKDMQKLLEAGKDCYKIALDPKGKGFSSEDFAFFLNNSLNKYKNIIFYIGGAFGLGSEFTSRCDKIVSLSEMTMAHKIALIVLFEQIYRAFTIIDGHPYHK